MKKSVKEEFGNPAYHFEPEEVYSDKNFNQLCQDFDRLNEKYLALKKACDEAVPVGWFDEEYKDYSRVNRVGWNPLFTHPAPVIASEQKPEGKNNAELAIDSNHSRTEQQRELDGKMEMGQLLGGSQNQASGDSEVKRNLLLIGDNFRGDDLKLAASIEALIALNDCGALVPHGIGGHARSLLACAALRLLTSPPNTADIERRVAEAIAHWIRCGDHHGVITSDDVLAGKWREYQ